MKILLATIFEYPHTGGLSTHMDVLGKALRHDGHTVEYASVSDYPRWFYVLAVKGPSFLINKVAPGWGMVWSHKMRKALILLLLLARKAGSRYDVVNAQDLFAVNAAALYDRFKRLPIVYTVHGYFRFEFFSIGSLREGSKAERYFITEEKKAFSRADGIVAGEAGRRSYAIDSGAAADKVRVIGNFIEPEAYRRAWSRSELAGVWKVPKGSFIILCPCRLTRVKGVEHALEAMDVVVKGRRDALLLFAGDGELRQELERTSRSLGLEENVRFLGNVAHDKMAGLYGLADVVVVPSISTERAEESMSISVMEGMASGKPVVTTPVGGLKDLVSHRATGYVVPEGNAEALGRAILELAGDPGLARRLGKAGRAYILEHHDAKTAAGKFVTAYQEALEG